MISLYTSYYIDSSPARFEELKDCLKRNINNPLIRNIYLVLEEAIELPFKSSKLIPVIIQSRPTYDVFMELVNRTVTEDGISIIANSDIYFDNSICALRISMKPNQAYALTRYEDVSGEITFLNRRDSQDAWIFKGKIKPVKADFMMGQPGCDNAFANRLEVAGYSVLNPSLTVKIYHLHNTGVRSYNVNVKVPQPYKLLNPTK